jgi:PAS domain S-box-containing protein
MSRYYEALRNENIKSGMDFIHRKRHGSIWRTTFSYLLGLCIILIGYYFKGGLGGDTALLILTLVVLGMLTVQSIVTVQKNLDLVTSIEFQNALFSSAFREGKLFSMIVSQDDQLYYADPGFYQLFPELVKSSQQVLDAIVKDSGTPQENIDKLNHALIAKNQEVFDVFLSKNGVRSRARMSIIPLPRPSGYFFVSARLFTEVRNAVVTEPSKEEEAHAILNALCEQVSDSAYVIDENGLFVCGTQPFLRLLGFHSIKDLQGRAFLEMVTNHGEESHKLKEYREKLVSFLTKEGKVTEVRITHTQIDRQKGVPFTLGKVII